MIKMVTWLINVSTCMDFQLRTYKAQASTPQPFKDSPQNRQHSQLKNITRSCPYWKKENGNNQSFICKHVNYDCTLMSLFSTIPYEICWIVDSGATDHIIKSSPIHNEINHRDYVNLSNGD